MSTKRLEHFKDWDKIYLEVGKVTTKYDDGYSMCFETNCINNVWVNDDDIFFFPDDLKQLANDGMPKQGDIIQVRDCSDKWWIDDTFVAFFDGKAITTPWWDEFNIWNEWRFPEWFEEVTLKNGLTYEVQWNDDDELVLKLK